jgi:hypothetical protein
LLPPNSFTIFASEPAVTLSATVNLDQTEPQVTFSASESSQSDMILELYVSDAVQPIATESFAVLGCDLNEVSTSPTIKLELVSCAEGVAEVVIAGGALVDQFGNSTATISHRISVDYSAPNIGWERPLISGTEEFEVSVTLISDEWFTSSETALQITGSATSCSHQTTSGATALRLELRGCSQGDLQIELAAGSIRDRLGNFGPATTLSLAVRLAAPAPAIPPAPQASLPAPSYEPPTQIEAPTEVPGIEITLPEPQLSESDFLVPTISEVIELSESATAEYQMPEQKLLGDPAPQPIVKKQDVTESLVVESTEAESTFEAQPVLLESKHNEPADSQFWIGLLGVISVLSLGGLGTHVLHLAKNNRARSIK